MDDERNLGDTQQTKEVSKSQFPEEFPLEIKRQVISFLTNDATSLIRFALCSKGWYDHILRHETAIYPNLWKELVYRRWRRIHRYFCHRLRSNYNRSRNEFEVWSSFRQMYKEKHQIDTDAIQQLKKMTTDLQLVLELNESDYLNESDTHIGQGWNHRCWHTLLRNRIDNYDILKTMAKRYLPSPSSPDVTTSTTNNNRAINANGSSSSSSSSLSLLSTSSSISTYDRLFGFLAACCIQNFHFADCLWQWKRLEDNQNGNSNNDDDNNDNVDDDDDDDLNTARLLEQYALLICQIQKTPLELLDDDEEDDNLSNAASRNADDTNCVDNNNDNNNDNNFDANYMSIMNSRATTYMDEIANVCRERISYELGENSNNNNMNMPSSPLSSSSSSSPSVTSPTTTITTTAKLKVINKVLVDQYGFSGNSRDYYNYKNVLLDHVLVSKTGMPLTLCVIYSCICRRLDIHVSVTGLPGHIVLGFDGNDNDTRSDDEIGSSSRRRRRRSFMDVFNGGTILSVVDCQEIVEGYGVEWNDEYLTPLPLKSTVQRLLNNLTNCHAQATHFRNTNPGPFHPDLMFQQRALGFIYRHPPEIVSSMLERFTQDLHIVLSPDLLRSYHLIPFNPWIDPVVNATHARVLLQLTSSIR